MTTNDNQLWNVPQAALQDSAENLTPIEAFEARTMQLSDILASFENILADAWAVRP